MRAIKNVSLTVRNSFTQKLKHFHWHMHNGRRINGQTRNSSQVIESGWVENNTFS